MPFGPLGDVADTAGPTTAEGIKSGQYTCFETRTGARCTFGSSLAKFCGLKMQNKKMKGIKNMFRVMYGDVFRIMYGDVLSIKFEVFPLLKENEGQTEPRDKSWFAKKVP